MMADVLTTVPEVTVILGSYTNGYAADGNDNGLRVCWIEAET